MGVPSILKLLNKGLGKSVILDSIITSLLCITSVNYAWFHAGYFASEGGVGGGSV